MFSNVCAVLTCCSDVMNFCVVRIDYFMEVVNTSVCHISAMYLTLFMLLLEY